MGLFICVLVLLLLGLMFGLRRWRVRYRLPPGPPSCPLIGHLHLLEAEAPYQSLASLADKWGKVFSLRLESVVRNFVGKLYLEDVRENVI
jgi:hypothetical protein